MDVSLFPNSRRPGVGLKPRREGQRPLLPQHARHCPVLEAGSASGHLVYPPLKPHEAYHVVFLGDGRYRLVYYLNPTGSQWDAVFSITFALPLGGVGTSREDVAFMIPESADAREQAVLMARSLIATEDLGTPAGGVTLRGAWNFRTPPGWDTIYTPVFNQIERPIAPMLVIRVETDWYVHETEFRYVLQPGEGISGSHSLPIGQVMFAPREDVTFRECGDDELAGLAHARDEFFREKSALSRNTLYGLPYSPHYFRTSRTRNGVSHESPNGVADESADTLPAAARMAPGPLMFARPTEIAPPVLPSPSTLKAGRNDPCPCGSGQKFKRCHGA